MQWLREYRHYDPLTHKDALLLRHMRYEGLIRWKVPVILSLLPTLLQAALVFFFIGILDLLLGLNRAVAFIVAITIGLAMIFMVGTTIAPAIQYLLDRREDICERSDAQCPYKSPQSWACLQITILATLVLEHIKRWATSWRIWSAHTCRNQRLDFTKKMVAAGDWFRFDLNWSRTRRKIHQSSRVDVNHDLIWGLRWVATTFVENIEAIKAVYHGVGALDPVTVTSVCSTIQRGDISMLDELVSSDTFSVMQVDEGARAMLSDQISASILQFFVKENPTFERSLLPQRLELYTRSRNASISLEMPEGLPDVQCPEIGKFQKYLRNGTFDCVMELDVGPLVNRNPLASTDLKVQFMLYIENLLQMESYQPYIGFHAKDINIAWEIVGHLIEKDPISEEFHPELSQVVARFLKTNKRHFTVPMFYHIRTNRLQLCLDHLFNIRDKLNKFYSLIRQIPETDINILALKEAIDFLVKGVLVSEEHSNHPIFNSPDWGALYAKCTS